MTPGIPITPETKVATLRQAATVGRVPLMEMINQLRAAVGQTATEQETDESHESYYGEPPAWFNAERVATTLVESELDPDVMPLVPLMQTARGLAEGEIVELVTTYLPVPGIDIMRKKGFSAWSTEQGNVIRTYFTRLPA